MLEHSFHFEPSNHQEPRLACARVSAETLKPVFHGRWLRPEHHREAGRPMLQSFAPSSLAEDCALENSG